MQTQLLLPLDIVSTSSYLWAKMCIMDSIVWFGWWSFVHAHSKTNQTETSSGVQCRYQHFHTSLSIFIFFFRANFPTTSTKGKKKPDWTLISRARVWWRERCVQVRACNCIRCDVKRNPKNTSLDRNEYTQYIYSTKKMLYSHYHITKLSIFREMPQDLFPIPYTISGIERN